MVAVAARQIESDNRSKNSITIGDKLCLLKPINLVSSSGLLFRGFAVVVVAGSEPATT